MFSVDVKQQQNNITLTPDKALPNDSETNIHSNNVPRHDSSPDNKHPQSVIHPLYKNHFSSLFILPRIKSLHKQRTNTQYDLHYKLLLMGVPRGWGEVSVVFQWRGCFLNWILVGSGSDTWKKTINMCIVSN